MDIVVDLSNTDALQALKNAQCEQALHELKNDLDQIQLNSLKLGSLLNVKLDDGGKKPDRYSQRAIAMLRPYLRGRAVARTR